jgi:hypothetical protein
MPIPNIKSLSLPFLKKEEAYLFPCLFPISKALQNKKRYLLCGFVCPIFSYSEAK